MWRVIDLLGRKLYSIALLAEWFCFIKKVWILLHLSNKRALLIFLVNINPLSLLKKDLHSYNTISLSLYNSLILSPQSNYINN